MLELPKEVSISPIVNVQDLSRYYGVHKEIEEELSAPRLLKVLKTSEDIEDILGELTILTKKGSYKKFLVNWKGKPISESTWITSME